MAFTENLQEKKNNARKAYKNAVSEWQQTRTADNINGDFEK